MEIVEALHAPATAWREINYLPLNQIVREQKWNEAFYQSFIIR